MEERTLLDRVREAKELARSGQLTRSQATEILAAVEAHLEQEPQQADAEETRLAQIDLALRTLSYSEQQALATIATHLGGSESGLLVASKIADAAGITRSVIVNGLRKLESAGIIRTHSLGMKGTRIDTVIPGWTDRLLERPVRAA